MSSWFWWAFGFLGFGGIVAVVIFWKILPENLRLWLIAIGAAILSIFALEKYGERKGEKKEQQRQKKENDEFTQKVNRHDEELRNLPDDAARRRLRSKDGKPRVG